MTVRTHAMSLSAFTFLNAVFTHAKQAWSGDPRRPLALLALRRTLRAG